MIRIGFTGSRAGMTPAQKRRVDELLRVMKPSEAHHGDCVGCDADFHNLCLGRGVPVVIHPPKNPKQRAYCKGAGRTQPARPYLDRNKDIVNDTTVLIACPKEDHEPAPARGQGTWSTVRYARKMGKTTIVVMPDGKMKKGR
jgi:hypothetical protein